MALPQSVCERGPRPAVRGLGRVRRGRAAARFVSVVDVVKVNLDFLDHPQRCGIFNLGSGKAATYNSVAAATINACRKASGESAVRWPTWWRMA